MRASQALAVAIFFIELSAAGPLRRDGISKHAIKQARVPFTIVPIDESTDIPFPTSTSSTSTSKISRKPFNDPFITPGTTIQTERTRPTDGPVSPTSVLPTSNLSNLPSTTSTPTPPPAAGSFQTPTPDSTVPVLATSALSMTTVSGDLIPLPTATTVETPGGLPSSATDTTLAISTSESPSPTLVPTPQTTQEPVKPTLEPVIPDSSTSPTNREPTSTSPTPQATGNKSTLRTITASPVFSTTTRTFASQQFTAVNSLTGFIEIEPAPPESRELTKITEPTPSPDNSDTVNPTKPLETSSTVASPLNTDTAAPTVPRFTLTNTNSLSLPPAPTGTPKFTLTNTNDIIPTKSIATIVIDISSLTAIKPSTTIVITKIPTTMPPVAPTPISDETYKGNLADAIAYNNFFTKFTAESTCDPEMIACIAGQVGTCDDITRKFVMKTCESTKSCFALPMLDTRGTFVGCFDKSDAAKILGGGDRPISTTPLPTPTPIIGPIPTVTGGQSSIDLGLVPLPASSQLLQPGPPIKPTGSPDEATTVTTNVLSPTSTVYVTIPTPEAAPVQTPSPNVPLPSPSPRTGTAGGTVYTIVPIPEVTNAPVPPEKEKETVTVTVTKTERA